jgi:hypothetical protein
MSFLANFSPSRYVSAYFSVLPFLLRFMKFCPGFSTSYEDLRIDKEEHKAKLIAPFLCKIFFASGHKLNYVLETPFLLIRIY